MPMIAQATTDGIGPRGERLRGTAAFFTPQERTAISHGMLIAAEQYDRDVATMRTAKDERCAKQFERQAATAREIAEAFED